MSFDDVQPSDGFHKIPQLPMWVTSARADTYEDVSFLSGAALATLHRVVTGGDVPLALWRDRLALRAAEACMVHAGRPERRAALRDVVHFLKPGDQPCPAGAVALAWQRAVARPISVGGLQRALPAVSAEQCAVWLDAGSGSPVTRAALVLEAVLQERPRDECAALIFADAVLAQAMGWSYSVPVFAAGLRPQDVHLQGAALQTACHKAIVVSADAGLRSAAELTRRAARLTAVAPKLRAKEAGAAVALFLSTDAVSPSVALSGPAIGMSARAARRLCDRLVDLGAVRELTGRDTFRLYGV